jgi:hypothetical protein
MDKLIASILIAMAVSALVVVAAIAGALFGAIGGGIVGWVFDETSAKVLASLNIEHLKMWEIGAALGFFGSFFKSSNTNNCN